MNFSILLRLAYSDYANTHWAHPARIHQLARIYTLQSENAPAFLLSRIIQVDAGRVEKADN